MILVIRLAWLLALKARRPVVISYSTVPSAKMSVRVSVACPSSCSGAMYGSVPRIVPSAVSAFSTLVSASGDVATSSAALRASPKSSSFGPLFVSMMLPGLRSRWTMPLWCAFASAPATAAPMRSTASSGRAPLLMRSPSDSPSISSITRYSVPLSLPTSKSVQMFG